MRSTEQMQTCTASGFLAKNTKRISARIGDHEHVLVELMDNKVKTFQMKLDCCGLLQIAAFGGFSMLPDLFHYYMDDDIIYAPAASVLTNDLTVALWGEKIRCDNVRTSGKTNEVPDRWEALPTVGRTR